MYGWAERLVFGKTKYRLWNLSVIQFIFRASFMSIYFVFFFCCNNAWNGNNFYAKTITIFKGISIHVCTTVHHSKITDFCNLEKKFLFGKKINIFRLSVSWKFDAIPIFQADDLELRMFLNREGKTTHKLIKLIIQPSKEIFF